MVSSEVLGRGAEAEAVLGWLPAPDSEQHGYAMARRLGVMSLIWNNRIWSASRATSYWTGRVAEADYGPCRRTDLNWAAPYATFNPTPCRRYPAVRPPAGASATLRTLVTYSGRIVREGSSGVPGQGRAAGVGVTTTGTFGPGTERALRRWQTRHGLSSTGVVGVATWRALLRSQAR